MKQKLGFWEFMKQSAVRSTREYFAPYAIYGKTKQLEKALDATKGHEMSREERESQRRSFAYGNVALSNSAATREVIDRAADVLHAVKCDGYAQFTEREEEAFAALGKAVAKIKGEPEPEPNAFTTVYEHPDDEIARLKKLVEAADYLQHCRRSHPGFTTQAAQSNKARVQRASDHYDHLRGQVKL